MKRQTLVRLCLALFVFAATLGIVGMADQNANAMPCCSDCDARYENCLAGFLYPECGGDEGCCGAKVASCWLHCSMNC
jgi:hypothetical protein